MGEEKEDPQKLKRIAATAYEYDNDPRWAEYWSNILIPPSMASRSVSDVQDHYKRKFYQRYIVPSLSLSHLGFLFLLDIWDSDHQSPSGLFLFLFFYGSSLFVDYYVYVCVFFFLSKEMLSWVVFDFFGIGYVTCKM